MHTVPGACPVCGQEMIVTRLHCRNCDSALEGRFELGRFYRLNREQLHFLDTFIRSEGKLNRVQEELGLSYPTVRNRLHEAIRALGYKVRDEPSLSPEQRKGILDDLADGKITSEEAIQLLQGD